MSTVARMYLVYQGDSIELPLGETVIGRDAGCALRFNDPAMSRRHVRIVRRRDELFVEDLGSRNGTLVNGERAKAPLAVRDGDTIEVGTRELVVLAVATTGVEPATLDLERLAKSSDFQSHAPTTQEVDLADSASKQRCPRCSAPVAAHEDLRRLPPRMG